MRIRARVHERDDGSWVAHPLDGPPGEVEATTREGCVAALVGSARQAEEAVALEIVPRIVGVAEAAAIIGWDKRRVVTYLDRDRFPRPLQTLASGRIWLREDVERFAREWHERQRARRRPRPGPDGA